VEGSARDACPPDVVESVTHARRWSTAIAATHAACVNGFVGAWRQEVDVRVASAAAVQLVAVAGIAVVDDHAKRPAQPSFTSRGGALGRLAVLPADLVDAGDGWSSAGG
jgi:hypothetical protein